MTYQDLNQELIIDGPHVLRIWDNSEEAVIFEKFEHELSISDRERLETLEIKYIFPRIDTIDGTPEAVTVLEFVEDNDE